MYIESEVFLSSSSFVRQTFEIRLIKIKTSLAPLKSEIKFLIYEN